MEIKRAKSITEILKKGNKVVVLGILDIKIENKSIQTVNWPSWKEEVGEGSMGTRTLDT